MDVAFIAKEMGVSRSLLFNKIKALTGLGIIDYVNKLRIDQASYLLLNTSMNLTEISAGGKRPSRRFIQISVRPAMEFLPFRIRRMESVGGSLLACKSQSDQRCKDQSFVRFIRQWKYKCLCV